MSWPNGDGLGFLDETCLGLMLVIGAFLVFSRLFIVTELCITLGKNLCSCLYLD